MRTFQPTQESIDGYYAGMRAFWHPVLPVSEFRDDVPCAVELLETPIVLACLNGELVALSDVCRHFQAQLSLGEIRRVEGHGDCLMCPYHGWSYASDGQCVDIPQLEAGREIPATARVERYPVQVRYGLIWVCLEANPEYDIPTLPNLDNTAFLTGPLRTYEPWRASAPRVIMAALDDTHGPWVHEGLVGSRDNPEPPQHQVWREGQNLKVDIHMVQPNNATINDDSGSESRPVHIITTVGIPNTIHFSIQALGSDQVTLIWQAVCPRKYNETLTFWGSARNHDLDKPAWDDAFEHLQDTLREQDKRIVEGQRPWLLPPFWTKTELPVRPADLPLIEYQKWLEELGIAIQI
jgi:phenylpropionate dioxygenase-like ring-hydroxylating dioxygenase large terminal subunit